MTDFGQKNTFTITLVLLLCLTACSSEAPKSNLPLSLPFDVHKAGSKVESKIIVIEQQTYAFELEYSFKKDDRDNRAKVWSLAGGPFRKKALKQGELGERVELGSPFNVKLKISKMLEKNEQFLFDEIISNPRLTSWGERSLNAKLTNITLDPGEYKIYAENENNAPELQGVKVSLHIGGAYLGK